MVAALKFFITKPIKEDSDESDSSSDDEVRKLNFFLFCIVYFESK